MEMQRREPMIIKQLEVGFMDNFCYIIGDEKTQQRQCQGIRVL